MKLAFLGLGVMGAPMAGHLSAKMVKKATAPAFLAVYNRTTEKAKRWQEAHGHQVALTPKAACAGADFVFMCLGNDDDVRSVVYGAEGALAGLAQRAPAGRADGGGGDKTSRPVLVDHTTASPELARELQSRCAEKGIGFVDAPISGGEIGAQQGRLTVMSGGGREDFEQVRPLMAAYGAVITHMGESGSGQLAKLVNQTCIAGLLQSLSEGLHLAKAAGLNTEKLLATLSGGAAQSWQMEQRGATMVRGEFDFGFAVDWMVKDLRLATAAAKQFSLNLPALAMVLKRYQALQQKGHGRWDTSSLIALLEAEREAEHNAANETKAE